MHYRLDLRKLSLDELSIMLSHTIFARHCLFILGHSFIVKTVVSLIDTRNHLFSPI